MQKKAQVTLGALAPALGTWQGQKDWDGEPVGAGSKAMFFLASLPEFIDLLWWIQSADGHLQEQVDKEAGEKHHHRMWDTGHLEDLPHHHSCLQRSKHPEAALSAEVSMRQSLSEAGRGQGRRRGSTGPGAPEAAPRPGFSPEPEAGRCSGGRRGCLGVSKGQFQKLTVRAKTPVLFPSEVHVLCSGQFPSTSRSLSHASFAVLGDHKIVFHMVTAALWGQSSVSGWSQTQHHGLSSSGDLSWLPALPLPCAPHQTAQPCGDRPLRGREGAWQQAQGLTWQGWEREQPEGPGTVLVRHLEQAVQSSGLVSPEPSGQVGPIPVT